MHAASDRAEARWSGRGRQATQRHILEGDTASNGLSSIQVAAQGEPDLNPFPEDVLESSTTTTAGGWFGSSGRAKTQKALQPTPIQDDSIRSTMSLQRDETIRPTSSSVISPSTRDPKSAPQAPSSSSWFSGSRTSTPAPIVSASVTQPTSTVEEPPLSSPPSLIIATRSQGPAELSAAGRSSWFGSGRGSKAPSVTQSANSSRHGTPALQINDLPEDENEIDESMIATVTPSTFAQAQNHSRSGSDSQALSANRAVVPTSWFRIGGKRDSMTPSVDTHVPSLPPTPERAHSPPRTILVPINTLMPLASPSLSTLGSSSARYGLSFPLLGRGNVTLEDTFRQPDDEISKREG